MRSPSTAARQDGQRTAWYAGGMAKRKTDPTAPKGSQANPYKKGEIPARGYYLADDCVDVPGIGIIRPARFCLDERDPANRISEQDDSPIMKIP